MLIDNFGPKLVSALDINGVRVRVRNFKNDWIELEGRDWDICLAYREGRATIVFDEIILRDRSGKWPGGVWNNKRARNVTRPDSADRLAKMIAREVKRRDAVDLQARLKGVAGGFRAIADRLDRPQIQIE